MGRNKQLAVVTGSSTGIGYELAACCADYGFDLIVAADEPASHATTCAKHAMASNG